MKTLIVKDEETALKMLCNEFPEVVMMPESKPQLMKFQNLLHIPQLPQIQKEMPGWAIQLEDRHFAVVLPWGQFYTINPETRLKDWKYAPDEQIAPFLWLRQKRSGKQFIQELFVRSSLEAVEIAKAYRLESGDRVSVVMIREKDKRTGNTVEKAVWAVNLNPFIKVGVDMITGKAFDIYNDELIADIGHLQVLPTGNIVKVFSDRIMIMEPEN